MAIEHEWTDPCLPDRSLRVAGGRMYARTGEIWIAVDGVVPDIAAREIGRLAQEGFASSNAFQDDLAALLRAAGLPDGPRAASPHQVAQQELLPRIHWLAARERVLAERVTKLETAAVAESRRIRQEMLTAIADGTHYITWDDGERRGRPVDEPFILASEILAALDRIIPPEG